MEAQADQCSASDHDRESKRRYWEKLKADPARIAEYRKKKREAAKARHASEPERVLQHSRNWKRKNRDKVAAYKRAHRAANPEHYKQEDLRKYQKRRDAALAQQKARRMNDPDAAAAMRERSRLRREKLKQADPVAYSAAKREYRRQNFAKFRLSELKKSARAKGVAFDLDLEWISARLDHGICEMSGLPFQITDARGAATPTVDRINPNGPYTKANCRMIIWWLNRALSNLGEEYALNVFRAILRERGEIA